MFLIGQSSYFKSSINGPCSAMLARGYTEFKGPVCKMGVFNMNRRWNMMELSTVSDS